MTSSAQDLRGLISQLKTLKHQVPQDESLRRELYDAIREISYAVEAPVETVNRIAFAVSQFQFVQPISTSCYLFLNP